MTRAFTLDGGAESESEFRIVRTKRFAIKPDPEEAILQMNLLEHTFFVFRNSERATPSPLSTPVRTAATA